MKKVIEGVLTDESGDTNVGSCWWLGDNGLNELLDSLEGKKVRITIEEVE